VDAPTVGEFITVFTVTVDAGNVEAVNDAEPTDGPPGFRVEELSARTGAPVRTIREYQTWQVLHPPARVGRVGYYDDSHVRRMETISRLQERGYSIAAIRDLFRAWDQGAGLRDVLGIDDTIGVPADEASVQLSASQLEKLLPAITASPRHLRRAVKVGLVIEDGDRFWARSPSLVQLVADMIGSGLTPTAALDFAETVVCSASQIGAAVAGTLADGRSGRDVAAVEPLLRRGRMLLARAVASHTIDQVGRHLADRAPSVPGLGELIDNIRVGHVDEPTAKARTQRSGPAKSKNDTRPRRAQP
jgi:DNA-binding transcriptional MerR regulator